MYSDDMQINWDWLFFFLPLPLIFGDGMLYNAPSHVPVGVWVKVQSVKTANPTLTPVLENFDPLVGC